MEEYLDLVSTSLPGERDDLVTAADCIINGRIVKSSVARWAVFIRGSIQSGLLKRYVSLNAFSANAGTLPLNFNRAVTLNFRDTNLNRALGHTVAKV